MLRRFLLVLSLLAWCAAVAAADTVEVWKDPGCGCCSKWIEHLRGAGFKVRAHDVNDLNVARAWNGVPRALGSCHTARIGAYAIEGHVPASDIRRLLRERPKAAGLAVPGMPAAAPGMDASAARPFEVLMFTADGSTRVYRRYP